MMSAFPVYEQAIKAAAMPRSECAD